MNPGLPFSMGTHALSSGMQLFLISVNVEMLVIIHKSVMRFKWYHEGEAHNILLKVRANLKNYYSENQQISTYIFYTFTKV